MASVRNALGGLIRAHDPYPAVVVDRGWDVVMTNTGAQGFLDGVAEHLLQGPLNSYRITLHPDGMAPRILNFDEWARDLLGTLDRQVAATRDPRLRDAAGGGHELPERGRPRRVVAHARARHRRSSCRCGCASARAPTPTRSRGSRRTRRSARPVDITLEELHVELFHPADEATAAMVGGRTA